jgi:hypothetical protein
VSFPEGSVLHARGGVAAPQSYSAPRARASSAWPGPL